MINGHTIVWSFRNRIDVLIESIKSADENFPKEVNFCLVDAASNDESIKKLRNFVNTMENRTVRVCESAFRTNLSEAWNLGMMLSNTRFVIFSSSDVVFKSPYLFPTMVDVQAKSKAKYLLVENHAVFMLDKKIVSAIGWFDEEFVPGPHFDCDYMIRSSEAGINPVIMGNADYYEHGDTEEETHLRTTVGIEDRLPMNDYTNDQIFKNKWSSNWPGWEPFKGTSVRPHPPTNIRQVVRRKPEINPHPLFAKKYE